MKPRYRFLQLKYVPGCKHVNSVVSVSWASMVKRISKALSDVEMLNSAQLKDLIVFNHCKDFRFSFQII